MEPPGALDAEVAALYERYSTELLRYAATLAAGGDMARDAVQETFLRYFVGRRYGRRIENPRAWLHRVLRNRLLDYLKTAASESPKGEPNLEALADGDADPERLLQERESARRIASLLTVREFACFRLRARGLRYEEIGRTLGVRTGTVGALLARVQRKLRGAVEGRLLDPAGPWFLPEEAEAHAS